MKFPGVDYLHRLEPLNLGDRVVVTLLLMPPASSTPSGFYKIRSLPGGGVEALLLEAVNVDPRTEKAFYTSASHRLKLIEDALSHADHPTQVAIRGGAVWCGDLQDLLVERIMDGLERRTPEGSSGGG